LVEALNLLISGHMFVSELTGVLSGRLVFTELTKPSHFDGETEESVGISVTIVHGWRTGSSVELIIKGKSGGKPATVRVSLGIERGQFVHRSSRLRSVLYLSFFKNARIWPFSIHGDTKASLNIC
jgi:hypothetical protein